jgi:hypothetical protein
MTTKISIDEETVKFYSHLSKKEGSYSFRCAPENAFCGSRQYLSDNGHKPGRNISSHLNPTYRAIQAIEDDNRKRLIGEAWKALQAKGCKHYQYWANAQYESGHSDYKDPDNDVLFCGIELPNGEKVSHHFRWTDAILPACDKLGI